MRLCACPIGYEVGYEVCACRIRYEVWAYRLLV